MKAKKMTKKKILVAGILGAGLISFLLLVSCGQKTPTSPYAPDLFVSNLSAPQPNAQSLAEHIFKAVCQSQFLVEFKTSQDLEKPVDILLPCDSSHLFFPPNSVPYLVNISGLVVQGFCFKDGFITLLTFEPDGLVFLRPLLFNYRSHSKEGHRVKCYWYDKTKGDWKLEETGEVKNGRVLFNIRHFSTYKVVDGSTSNGSQKY